MIYIIAAILIFGVLIAVHELGHFLAAKAWVRSQRIFHRYGPHHPAQDQGRYHLLSAAAAHRLLCHGGRGGGLQRPYGPE